MVRRQRPDESAVANWAGAPGLDSRTAAPGAAWPTNWMRPSRRGFAPVRSGAAWYCRSLEAPVSSAAPAAFPAGWLQAQIVTRATRASDDLAACNGRGSLGYPEA